MLKGKTAVITGGSRGIGAAVTRRLSREGINTAVIYAGNEEQAKAICRDCSDQYGVKAASYRCDVSDYAAVQKVVGKIKEEFGTIDILVNNAGITRDGLILSMKEKDFDDVIEINLKGSFNMIRHIVPVFLRQRFGRIVNISSVAGIMGNAGQINYSASKAGIIGLTKTTARELASRKITCNAVAPGFIETDMTKVLLERNPELAKEIPLGRSGQPEEVAEAVLFLLKADYITGEIIRVDGGIAI